MSVLFEIILAFCIGVHFYESFWALISIILVILTGISTNYLIKYSWLFKEYRNNKIPFEVAIIASIILIILFPVSLKVRMINNDIPYDTFMVEKGSNDERTKTIISSSDYGNKESIVIERELDNFYSKVLVIFINYFFIFGICRMVFENISMYRLHNFFIELHPLEGQIYKITHICFLSNFYMIVILMILEKISTFEFSHYLLQPLKLLL